MLLSGTILFDRNTFRPFCFAYGVTVGFANGRILYAVFYTAFFIKENNMENRKEELTKIHLTDLRRYAREIGVKHPASYTKPVLIENVLKIENGDEKPSFSKRGRPQLKLHNTKDSFEEEGKIILNEEKLAELQTLAHKFVTDIFNVLLK